MSHIFAEKALESINVYIDFYYNGIIMKINKFC